MVRRLATVDLDDGELRPAFKVPESSLPLRLSEDSLNASFQAKAQEYLESVTDPATWDVTTGTGTVTTSATNTLLVASASGTAQGIRRVCGFALPTGAALVVRLKRDANLSVLDMRVRTNAYSGPKVYSSNLGVTAVPVGEWYDMVFPLAAAASLPASPLATDTNKITGIELQVTPSAGTVTTLEVESIRIAEGDSRPGVCFQFDDGRLDTYTQAYPILKAAGYRGSIAVEHTAVGAVGAGTASRMTLANYNEVYTDGWALMGHHTAQMTTLTTADQNLVYQASKDFLLGNGFTRGADHWVWPGGARSLAVDKVARKYWKTRRAVSPLISGATTVGVAEPYDPNMFYVISTTTVATIQARLDQVARTGGVLVLVFHSLVPSGATAEDWLISNFQELVNYCKSKGLVDYTYDEVFDLR